MRLPRAWPAKELLEEILEQIVAKTDGIPLFVEERPKQFWNRAW